MYYKFYTPPSKDKRISYATQYLEKNGFYHVENERFADFILLGVNPSQTELCYQQPVFAGNVTGEGIFDYTKEEDFAVKNAFLTAEAALAVLITNCETSLLHASVLITGYGRIGKALHRYLAPFTSSITVCARNIQQRETAKGIGAQAMTFDTLQSGGSYDIVINTVPDTVLDAAVLSKLDNKAVLLELASFPGGLDYHAAQIYHFKLIKANGLPGKISPATAGYVLGETVERLAKEVL